MTVPPAPVSPGSPADATALRLETLRLRGVLERDEAAAAVAEVHAGTRRLRDVVRIAAGVADAISGQRRGWLGMALQFARERPALVSVAIGVLRSVVRRPWLIALAVGGAVLGTTAWRAANDRVGSNDRARRRGPGRSIDGRTGD